MITTGFKQLSYKFHLQSLPLEKGNVSYTKEQENCLWSLPEY